MHIALWLNHSLPHRHPSHTFALASKLADSVLQWADSLACSVAMPCCCSAFSISTWITCSAHCHTEPQFCVCTSMPTAHASVTQAMPLGVTSGCRWLAGDRWRMPWAAAPVKASQPGAQASEQGPHWRTFGASLTMTPRTPADTTIPVYGYCSSWLPCSWSCSCSCSKEYRLQHQQQH